MSFSSCLESKSSRISIAYPLVSTWECLGGCLYARDRRLGWRIGAECKYVLAYGYDYGWTTNLPVEEFLADDALIATHHDGEPISVEHGGPARLIVPACTPGRVRNGYRARISARGSAGFLGTERLSHARRPLDRGAIRLLMHDLPETQARGVAASC